MNDELAFKIGFLKPSTTTVDSGAHFDDIQNILTELDEILEISIFNNKWLLTKMLSLQSNWDDNNKEIYTLLFNQLLANIRPNT